MEIKAMDIVNRAFAFANELLNMELKKEPLTIDKYKTIYSPEILATKYGTDFAMNLALGAIIEYHEQLRGKLLEQGIDIGDIN